MTKQSAAVFSNTPFLWAGFSAEKNREWRFSGRAPARALTTSFSRLTTSTSLFQGSTGVLLLLFSAFACALSSADSHAEQRC